MFVWVLKTSLDVLAEKYLEMKLKERLNPRDSGKFIADNSTHVAIQKDNMDKVAKEIYEQMKVEKYSMECWKAWPLHPKEMNEEAVDWIFVIDSLNFSFWLPGEKQFQLEYGGVVYEDYEALCAAVNRALNEGIAVTTPSYYENITLENVQHIFRSCNGTKLPLLEERTKILQENGKILQQNYSGSFSNLIQQCNNDVIVAMELILENFPSFQDFGNYKNTEVSFCKRVQILLADIWACFENKNYGYFKNIEKLTMFPDYRVPQTLLSLNLIKYSAELMCKLQNNVILEHNSFEEIEIRGCSIHSVELLRESLQKLYPDDVRKFNSIIIDFYMWDYATKNSEKMKGFSEHKTRSIFY